MKKNRLIFYSVFGFLLLLIFVFSLYMDANSENLSLLIKLQGMIGWMKFCSLTLLIMFGTNIILHVRDNNRNQRQKAALLKEITELKAKLYDQNQGKQAPLPQGTME